jgi:hypothetical protein
MHSEHKNIIALGIENLTTDCTVVLVKSSRVKKVW